MKTAFATGPGFFSARSHNVDPAIPPGVMRFHLARIEAYDGPIKGDETLDQTKFTILAALCDGKPEVARAMLELGDHINANRALIEAEAKK